MRTEFTNFAGPTAYEAELAHFAALKRDLQKRKRARWRLRIALMIAGRKVRPARRT